ncbi:MAG: alanine--tRNA ligase [Clostridia bacterium]|nr:alanine--tRNA ligase [Clostridia bacterium]
MEWMSLNTLREKYLSFFESKEHLRLNSFSLVPNNDKSLLLINSGMAPMKKYFTGEVTPPKKRVTTCQKCIRTPDIESVGKTARHGTFFEMLGNFSFGDYFKHEATAWAWEFCTKVLEMPVDKLWVTIYQDDDEAFDIWTKEVGVSPDRIVRMGKEDNFWEHGTGPCGPCSELHYDRGEKYGCGKPDCAIGCECDRYVEFWNLVFTQFDSDGQGNYTPLDNPNIDTGMGLERLACISQGVDNIFEVDTIQNIMKHLSKICGVTYKTDEKADVSMRVITDHIRSTSFMIADGVMPSNEGRGYVLRRLLRRAARHGRLLGINRPFLVELIDTVVGESGNAYPELKTKIAHIKKVVGYEEESFLKTIDQGLSRLNEFIASGEKVLSGEEAFKLNDTYGFPLDLTCDILEEKGISVDVEGFKKLMQEQKDRARNARKESDTNAWKGDDALFEGIEATKFTGYSELRATSNVTAIVVDGELVSSATEGQKATVVLDTTPFYAESGGQVGDQGIIRSGLFVFNVNTVNKNGNGIFLHNGVVTSGTISIGDSVLADVCTSTRAATCRNHTSAHLLQAALRKVLGDHVEQAGQLVNNNEVRFDFTHFSALTAEELEEVEKTVNQVILSGANVETREMPIEEAKAMGAMALFGEKYGDTVRVVSVDGFSVELCGGTHVTNASSIGLFKIISESSVAAGIRRITAITGNGVLKFLDEYKALVAKTAAEFKLANPLDIALKAAQVNAELKEKDRQISILESKLAASKVSEMMVSAVDVDNVRVIAKVLKQTELSVARTICDTIKSEFEDIVLVFAVIANEKLTFISACGKDAIQKGCHAGNIVREVAKIAGGNGGGKPDSAMAGGKDISKADTAIASVIEIVSNLKK